jgi:F0F1-type ATP synthase assembly protein I
VGIEWASRVTTLSLEFALPTLAGVFLDKRWGTSPVGVLVGMVLGFAVGMTHLLQIAKQGSGPARGRGNR